MSNEQTSDATQAQSCWPSKAKSLPGATTQTDLTSRGGSSSSRGELVAKIGTVVSAIMASSCCWLPVLLLAVGVSGAGIASALEVYRPVFMVVTFGFLGMAFYFTYRPGPAVAGQTDCCAPTPVQADRCQPPAGPPRRFRFNMMAMNKVMLWAVTVLAVVFLFFPQYVTGVLGTGNQKITADMTRSVIRIEGMTCYGWQAKAAGAIHQAPGVLAVNVDYEKRIATVGTDRDQAVPREEILESLKAIGYRGEFAE